MKASPYPIILSRNPRRPPKGVVSVWAAPTWDMGVVRTARGEAYMRLEQWRILIAFLLLPGQRYADMADQVWADDPDGGPLDTCKAFTNCRFCLGQRLAAIGLHFEPITPHLKDGRWRLRLEDEARPKALERISA